ncbi:hypothetical protein GCM10010260_70370 [Streptomyces filipinensis]|uniref:Uncharacterized protein n=1 Tax=Streptomyces filipinensis TaxID=66887 RepID=A0A918II04_9ACTN|nr:hypothetical protein [Streptomyces filipinensis]GGV20205.1 hypothetical protein GCM10010260_70370 [Streptomyces filipinensis]
MPLTALGVGEAGVEVCLERLHDADGAALAGRGLQLVEAGVAEAADGLAAEAEAAGDGADRPAFLQRGQPRRPVHRTDGPADGEQPVGLRRSEVDALRLYGESPHRTPVRQPVSRIP